MRPQTLCLITVARLAGAWGFSPAGARRRCVRTAGNAGPGAPGQTGISAGAATRHRHRHKLTGPGRRSAARPAVLRVRAAACCKTCCASRLLALCGRGCGSAKPGASATSGCAAALPMSVGSPHRAALLLPSAQPACMPVKRWVRCKRGGKPGGELAAVIGTAMVGHRAAVRPLQPQWVRLPCGCRAPSKQQRVRSQGEAGWHRGLAKRQMSKQHAGGPVGRPVALASWCRSGALQACGHPNSAAAAKLWSSFVASATGATRFTSFDALCNELSPNTGRATDRGAVGRMVVALIPPSPAPRGRPQTFSGTLARRPVDAPVN